MKFNKNILFLIIIFVLGISLRLYFMDFHSEITTSDEGEYLVLAKSVLDGDVLLQWSYYRPFLLPLLWVILFKIGFGETALHLSVFLFSILAIIYSYLLGRELFNSKIGLFTAFFIAIFNQDIFYSTKLLLNTPVLASWLICSYYFLRALKTDSSKLLYFSACLTGLATLLYSQNIALFIFFIVFMLFNKGWIFSKRKYIYFILIYVAFYFTTMLYSYLMYGNPFKFLIYGLWISYISTEVGNKGLFYSAFLFIKYFYFYFGYLFLFFLIPSLFLSFKTFKNSFSSFFSFIKLNKLYLFYTFFVIIIASILMLLINKLFFQSVKSYIAQFVYNNIFSLVLLLSLVVIVIIFRNYFEDVSKSKKINFSYLFLLFWFIISFVIILKTSNHFEPRYFMPTLVPLFIIISIFLFKIGKIFNFNKLVSLLLILILIFGAYFQIQNAKHLFSKEEVKEGLKEFGFWLKNNTSEDKIIVGPWNFAITYYSDRKIYYFPHGHFTSSTSYETFNEELNKLKPSNVILYNLDKYNESNEYYRKYLKENLDFKLIYLFKTNLTNTTIEVYES